MYFIPDCYFDSFETFSGYPASGVGGLLWTSVGDSIRHRLNETCTGWRYANKFILQNDVWYYENEYRIYRWLIARLQYPQCVNGGTAVLHRASYIPFILLVLGCSQVIKQGYVLITKWWLYYRMFPPAIDIIPTSLAVAYSNGKYTN